MSYNLSLWRSYSRALLRRAADPDKALLIAPSQRQVELSCDQQKLQRYRQLCDITPSGALPPCWPSILSFPLQLALLTEPHLPLPAMGLIQTRNRIHQWQPMPCDAKLHLTAKLNTPSKHAKGILLTIETAAYLQGNLCWQQQAEYLYRMASTGVANSTPVTPAEPEPSRCQLTQLRLTPALSRRYAWLSGDLNPIHLSRFTARGFGLPAAIAHGMHLKAMTLAKMVLPTAFAVDVRFSSPFYLPGQASLNSKVQADGSQFFCLTQSQSQKAVLSGEILPI